MDVTRRGSMPSRSSAAAAIPTCRRRNNRRSAARFPRGERVRGVAYLGPPGTFTEEALLSCPEARDAELVPLATVPEVIAAVEAADVDGGVVPIENSIEGSVNITLD